MGNVEFGGEPSPAGHSGPLSADAPPSAGGGLVFPETLPTLKDMEQGLIDEALRRAGGNQTIAAELLGLSRRALNNRIRRSDEPS
jgi:DNA-binding NtrC family response regulator